jgi:Leucine-rich repeat (LRR) protein
MLKRMVPFLLGVGILFSIGWYLLEYDREFTRDMLISQARYCESSGRSEAAARLYDLAYDYTGKDEDVAIELANQYKNDGNYTKAEQTLTRAIADGGTAELYIALCKTYVEQDKLLDASSMLDRIADPNIKLEMDRLRPAAPEVAPAPGYYNQYISLSFTPAEGTLLFTLDGDFPSIKDNSYTDPIPLPGGETTVYAIRVAENGLVSPLTIVGYTIGGVIEEAKFADPAMELAMREILGADPEDVVMTDELWEITEFTVPADAQSLADLSFLPYLEKLTLRDHKLDSLSPLAPLVNLKEVDLSGSRFPAADLKYLATFQDLEKLSLSGCGLSTIADLAGAKKLVYLDLSSNTLRKLEALIPMSHLQELYLQHNAVTSLDVLSNLSELTKLDISYNAVSNIAPLAGCTALTWLNAGNNALSSLKGIDAFSSLTHLYLDHNKLTDVVVLAKLTGLIELDISNNMLEYINELCALTALVELNCSYNKLYYVPIFPKESALSILDASHNNIDSLDPLARLENLTYVYMDYNELKSLDSIADCFRLVMVSAYGNEIRDVSKLTDHNIIVNYDPTN